MERMAQGSDLVCQSPITVAPIVQSYQYSTAPTVRAQVMDGTNSWDTSEGHTTLPTGINLQAPPVPVSRSLSVLCAYNSLCI